MSNCIHEEIEKVRQTNAKFGKNIPQEILISMLDMINAAWWVYEIDTGYDFLSQGWCQVLGYDFGELENNVNSWLTIIHPDDKAKAEKRLKDHIDNGTPYRLEARYLHKSGKYIKLKDKGAVVYWNEDGSPAVVVGFQERVKDER